jgi:hypothetical protein
LRPSRLSTNRRERECTRAAKPGVVAFKIRMGPSPSRCATLVQAVDDLFASPLHEGDRPQAMPFLGR